jgi:1,5-anhydro-D-fructose reductase (1,5-anhydro-D-mannitol-forming)
MTLGWGIVGTGTAADRLVGPGVYADPESQIVAVVSRDEGRAREFAARHGARHAYTRYQDLLADPDVDVVYIATPNAHHATEAISAAEAGKHILCEKPLAATPADALRIVEAARAHGVKLGTNFQSRHYAPVDEIHRLVQAGEIGDVLIVQAESSGGANPLKGWRTEQDLAGMGTVNNIGVHPLDLIRYLVGAEVTEVAALTDVGSRDELERLALILLRLDSGTVAYVNANQKVPFYQPDLELYGSAGSILGRNCTRPGFDSQVIVRTADGERTIESSTKDGFERAVAAFSRAVLEDRTPSASGEDGLRSVEIVDAIRTSARSGAIVEVTGLPLPA